MCLKNQDLNPTCCKSEESKQLWITLIQNNYSQVYNVEYCNGTDDNGDPYVAIRFSFSRQGTSTVWPCSLWVILTPKHCRYCCIIWEGSQFGLIEILHKFCDCFLFFVLKNLIFFHKIFYISVWKFQKNYIKWNLIFCAKFGVVKMLCTKFHENTNLWLKLAFWPSVTKSVPILQNFVKFIFLQNFAKLMSQKSCFKKFYKINFA